MEKVKARMTFIISVCKDYTSVKMENHNGINNHKLNIKKCKVFVK